MTGLTIALAALIGIGLGSIPFGLLLTRLAGFGDIRQIGSGNIGATNVLRTGRKDLALLTLLLDIGKGVAAVLLAAGFGDAAALAAGAGAVVGHVFTPWLGFRGGKGVATAFGVLLGLAWPIGVALSVIWLAVAVIFRMSSLASLAGCAAAPVASWILADFPGYAAHPERTWVVLAIALLLISRHHENIARLLAGTESKIGQASNR